MTKFTLKYETRTCGRCGGSGSYSYNQMHGSVCYGCSGRKTVPTKAGRTAQLAIQAFIAEHFSVAIKDVKVGDRIKVDGFARTVTSVYFHAPSDYVTSQGDYVTITFDKPIRGALGPYTSYGTSAKSTVVKAVGGADWLAVVAFARTIKKGVTIVETEKPTSDYSSELGAAAKGQL